MNIIIIGLAALCNRVRGGGLFASFLPGHARLWAAPSMGALSWFAGADLSETLAWGLGYFLWSTLPVNRWDVLGRRVQTAEPTLLEDAIENLAWNMRLPYFHGPLFVRECLGVMPVLIALAFLSCPGWVPLLVPVYAVAAVLSTELAHHLPIAKFRVGSELLVGALWGALLVFVGF